MSPPWQVNSMPSSPNGFCLESPKSVIFIFPQTEPSVSRIFAVRNLVSISPLSNGWTENVGQTHAQNSKYQRTGKIGKTLNVMKCHDESRLEKILKHWNNTNFCFPNNLQF